MSPINEFEGVVDHIHGVYLDSTTGFEKLREWFLTTPNNSVRTEDLITPESGFV